MIRTIALVLLGIGMGIGSPALADGGADDDVVMVFDEANNEAAADVEVIIYTNTGQWEKITVSIRARATAVEKRDAIKAELERDRRGDTPPGRGPLTVENHGPDGLRITGGMPDKTTSVVFKLGNTREGKDRVSVKPGEGRNAQNGKVEFAGFFEPFTPEGNPSDFACGFITDLGETVVELNSFDLDLLTDGVNIARVFYERLEPLALSQGVLIELDGDDLFFSFDPALTQETGGVVFGTTAPGNGCSGGTSMGTGPVAVPCPEDLNGDGLIDLGDLAQLLSVYGAHCP